MIQTNPDRTKIVLLVSIACIVLTSCSLINHKNFYAHKHVPFGMTTPSLKTYGIYFPANFGSKSYLPNLFFLNQDGSVESTLRNEVSRIDSDKFWQEPDEYLKKLEMSSIVSSGHFYADNGILTIQTFEMVNPGGFYTTTSVELCGYIINDSTFRLIETVCDIEYKNKLKSGVELPFKEQEYRLFKTAIKPDSSKIWFKRKKWYQKEVWFNQK
jgi:hypothetical protein